MSQVDVVVIGGGVAGLMAAAFLARDGREVVLLEQNAVVGGCIGGFNRQGYYFDGGAQSFESLGLVFPLLDKLGRRGAPRAERTDYRLRTPTVDCPLSQGYDAVEAAFCAGHPQSTRELRRFFRRAFRVARTFEQLATEGRTPFLHEGTERVRALLRIGLSRPAGVAALWDAHHRYQRDVAVRTVSDPGLAALLSSFGYRDASFFAFGAFLACWQQDYWRPRRGMQRLADVLAECVIEHGAKIRTRASVKEIVRADGRVVGVKLADGDELRAPLVVAACDHTHLERDLLGLRAKEPAVDDVSDAFFTLFLGLDWSDAELSQRLPEHHTFLVPVHRDFRLDPSDRLGHRHRWIHVSRCSRSELDQAPEGCTSLTVQTTTRMDWAARWARGSDGASSARYQELKQQVEEELLDTLEQFVPGIRERIRLRFSASPWTYQRYTRNIHGASAGWTWDPRRSQVRERLGADLAPATQIRTGVAGLYQCGHWTASPGSVPGAALSGWEAYQAIVRDGR